MAKLLKLIFQTLSALTTLRGFAEQQKKDYRGLIRQLSSLERDMKALRQKNSTQTTLDRFDIAK